VFATPLIRIEAVGEIAERSNRHMSPFYLADNNGPATFGQ
jgi:hypothetical protein